ncbi:uncharacterized protein BDZ99DRAFT_480656 [Mytilinidion resinicola]|uniref:Uncharacterized protein n=1 Tax=Mytilinidion resinicola TaxID=574789 RepID=A0A6A6Y9N7_9PEZI|nr:uncharacterized protein BDZ99DRAFT_480656 [Mytilinidion resinicola]KAF2805263.1 hypothetical protein BDZ99DRAFT_480656 [Mytilinidion resinicola]
MNWTVKRSTVALPVPFILPAAPLCAHLHGELAVQPAPRSKSWQRSSYSAPAFPRVPLDVRGLPPRLAHGAAFKFSILLLFLSHASGFLAPSKPSYQLRARMSSRFAFEAGGEPPHEAAVRQPPALPRLHSGSARIGPPDDAHVDVDLYSASTQQQSPLATVDGSDDNITCFQRVADVANTLMASSRDSIRLPGPVLLCGSIVYGRHFEDV